MAMNEKLVAPYPFTVAQTGTVSSGENLANERLGRVASFGGDSPYIILDLGAVVPVDTLALLATSAGPNGKWRAVGNTVNDFGTGSEAGWLFDTGMVPVWASPEARKRLHRQGLTLLPEVVNIRFLYLESATAFTAGRLVIGQSFTAEDTADIGYSYKVVDLGQARQSSGGLVDRTVRGKVLEFAWKWSWMTEGEARGALLDVLAYAGTTRDLLLIMNPDAPDLHNVIAYGSLTEEVEPVNVAGGVNLAPGVDQLTNAYEAAFRLRSRLILNL